MSSFAPIALFVYNRPEHTQQTLQYLQQNTLATQSELFIFSDGPKKISDRPKVEKVRQIIKQVSGFKSVSVIEGEHNIGLANSVIKGVSKLCQSHEKVIVFEDDLIASPYTLSYFNDALSLYQQEDQIMHIGAYMFPIDRQGLPETFFNRIATSWGWATWERAWQHFEPDIDKLLSQFDADKITQFSIDRKMNFWKQMQEFKCGKNNSWAVRWYASMFLRGGLALHPAQSLIHNIGHDGTGIHSGNNSIYDVSLKLDQIQSFPKEIKEDPKAYQALKFFFAHRKGSLLQRVIRLFKNKMWGKF